MMPFSLLGWRSIVSVFVQGPKLHSLDARKRRWCTHVLAVSVAFLIKHAFGHLVDFAVVQEISFFSLVVYSVCNNDRFLVRTRLWSRSCATRSAIQTTKLHSFWIGGLKPFPSSSATSFQSTTIPATQRTVRWTTCSCVRRKRGRRIICLCHLDTFGSFPVAYNCSVIILGGKEA
jgi:hypothetical protein